MLVFVVVLRHHSCVGLLLASLLWILQVTFAAMKESPQGWSFHVSSRSGSSDCTFPPVTARSLSHHLSSHLIPHSLHHPQKRSGLQGTSTEHGITSYNKTMYILLYHICIRQPSRSKRVPKGGKRVSNFTCFHCWEFHKITKLLNHNIYAEDYRRLLV